ncbi:MAG: hypothetical protein JW795_08660 [Chitinivibrionales bacterium]|nr:hypothetical protein [Chitinivibrionales bacterium]
MAEKFKVKFTDSSSEAIITIYQRNSEQRKITIALDSAYRVTVFNDAQSLRHKEYHRGQWINDYTFMLQGMSMESHIANYSCEILFQGDAACVNFKDEVTNIRQRLNARLLFDNENSASNR